LDLKLDNIFVIDARGSLEQPSVPQLVIGDFGTSRIGVDHVDVARDGEITGNAPNRAPEVMTPRDRTRVDISRADMWSLGCIVFEMLEGRHPFVVGDGGDLRARVGMGAIPRVSECWRARVGGSEEENRIKSAIENVVSERLLVRDARDRGEIEQALEAAEMALWPRAAPIEDRDATVRWVKEQQRLLVDELKHEPAWRWCHMLLASLFVLDHGCRSLAH